MRILSGIQPSGKLHIGNYFGAMKNMFDLQYKGEGAQEEPLLETSAK